MKAPDQKASSRATPLRYLHGPWRHIRSNVVAYLALVVAVGGSGSYALAAVSASNGTIAVCVDKGSGVMHLAKHQRCGSHQSRIGLRPALEAMGGSRTKRRHNRWFGPLDHTPGCWHI